LPHNSVYDHFIIISELKRSVMLKEAAGITGGAVFLTPLGLPLALHGIAGILVGGAGLFVADAVMKKVEENIHLPAFPYGTKKSEEEEPE